MMKMEHSMVVSGQNVQNNIYADKAFLKIGGGVMRMIQSTSITGASNITSSVKRNGKLDL